MLRWANFRPQRRLRSYACLCCLLFSGMLSVSQPEARRMTFYTAQTTYSLPVLERNGVSYIGLFEILEPIGAVSAKPDGNKWRIKFRDVESYFEVGKSKARVRGANVDLTSPFVLENGRGYVPLAALAPILQSLLSTGIDVHQESRRVFIGVTPVKLTARKLDAGKVAFSFSAPVNPQIATEAGKLRMSFTREPLVSETPIISFDDPNISRASYAEANGAVDVTVIASAPLQASFSEDRRTITVSVLPPSAAPQQTASPPPPVQPSPAQAQAAAPKPRPRAVVLIDAAHGGEDRGATLTDKVSEKDVTLALARRLKHELELRGIDSALLRDSDTSLSFDERVSAANTPATVLYVAIHSTASGTGIHLYTALLSPQPRRSLAFVRVQAAQASSVENSRAIVSAISTELLKRDTPVTSMAASVSPLALVLPPAIAVELAPPPSGTGDDLSRPAYQQATAVALANGIAAARSRILQEAR